MKKMKTGNITLNVVEHIITRNGWEYYVTDDKFNEEVVRCLVLGFEHELGDVYLPEIEPYILTRTKDLNQVMPAPGYEWAE